MGQQRNEFGLDVYNALDVKKERGKSTIPWVIGAMVALLAAFAIIRSSERPQ